MSGIPLLLPQPPASATAVTLYVLVGIAVCALVTLPLPAHHAHPDDYRFGIEPVRALGAVITVVACVALWPAALLWTTTQNSNPRAAAARAHRPTRARARRSAQRSALRTVMRSDDEGAELPVYLAQPTSVVDAAAGDAQWVDAAAARVVGALTERRLLDAVLGARSLVWDVEFTFGPNSSQLGHATELLAHVCREIGDDIRAVRLYARAATGWAQNFGAEHPSACAAFDRATALWTKARAAEATDPVTAVLVASVTRLFASAGMPHTPAP
ncbi:tetratricopeptide repeat protein [Streptacidiphilus jiangxiensis]|uniref:tetratricopeptide repeat protein n=1 Tax=Streptacidiphilus jiangxiensis TaxID=235985 RepID=UPI000942CC43|nr:tetratricopeptide repeat protein [Streptacidiphilus jiangxiensis]